eukprot:358582-Chlamydomonas_euryale.AAC.12
MAPSREHCPASCNGRHDDSAGVRPAARHRMCSAVGCSMPQDVHRGGNACRTTCAWAQAAAVG